MYFEKEEMLHRVDDSSESRRDRAERIHFLHTRKMMHGTLLTFADRNVRPLFILGSLNSTTCTSGA